MASVKSLNPDADVSRKAAALAMTLSAAKGLQDILRSNLGPKGTLKMLVGGSGDIKMTKDGNTLLHEMQIQHPTAALIARTATAIDDMCGDGTTSGVIIIGELLKQAERYLLEGQHPRILSDGFEEAKTLSVEYLEKFKMPMEKVDREKLLSVAHTSLCTKLPPELANMVADIVVDAILCIKQEDTPLDLHMIEIMHMHHRVETESRLVKGLVMDHGARHPDMPKKLKNCFVLTCNVSLEYEKTETSAGFFYNNAQQKQALTDAERKFTDDVVRKVIDFKRTVCGDTGKSFVIFNQKGIDPIALDMLAKEGIFALRRAKKRNMERLALACGGYAVNSFDDMTEECLGYADLVYETTLGEEKYTFVEGVQNPHSCTILLKGAHKHQIAQVKEAVRDGLRSVKNVLEDGSLIPGAGAFEVGLYNYLMDKSKEITGKKKLGVQAFAEGMMIIPKVLAENSGHDAQDAVIALKDEFYAQKQQKAKAGDESEPTVGIDIDTGKAINPIDTGVYDNYRVKRQLIHST
mmetsp:Transcript_27064/g.69651  ORF Transcript_27064/g.69651 Transcript_27064/m.69651 type:complete len:521 (+) Transcript_27064:132-1694(+)